MLRVTIGSSTYLFPDEAKCKHVGLSLVVEKDDEVLFLSPCCSVSRVYRDDTREESAL